MTDSNPPFDLDALRRNEAWLRPMVAALVGDDASGDVLQRTWLRAWQRGPTAVAALRPWLARVATRLALSHRRAERVRARHEGAVADAQRDHATESTLATVERLSVQRAVSAAVSDLAEPYRTAVLLRYYHGLPLDEVARRTATSPANVRQRVHRGLLAMRERLERELGSDWRRAPAVLALLQPIGAPLLPPAASTTLPLWLTMNKLRAALAVVVLASVVSIAVLQWPGAAAPIGEPRPDRPVATAQTDTARPPSVPEPAPARIEANAPPAAVASVEIAGRVLDMTGQPVPGVAVAVLDQLHPEAAARDLGRSDAAGAFRTAPLPATARLAAGSPWFAIAAGTVGKTADAPPPMLVVAPERTLHVTVVDERGGALDATATAKVHGLVDFPLVLDDAVEVQAPAPVREDAGRFRWPRLPLATTTLTVRCPGFAPWTAMVDAGTPQELLVTLRAIAKGARLITGIVTDGRGALVGGAEVGFGQWRTTSSSFGAYQLAIEPGAQWPPEQTLFAALAGWCPAVEHGFGARVLAAANGEVVQDLLLAHQSASIAGRVVDTEGKPLAGVAVYPWQVPGVSDDDSAEDLAAPRTAQPLMLSGNRVRCHAITGGDGAFELRGLDRRDYRLRVYSRDDGVAWTTAAIAAGARDVVLAMPADLLGLVAGRATARDGSPAAGLHIDVYVQVHSRDGGLVSVGVPQEGTTDADGRFRFERLARDGVSLEFRGRDWIAQSLDLERGAASDDLRIALPRRCHVRVETVEPAFADASIRFVDDHGAGVPIHEFRASTHMATETYQLHAGKSEVLAVADTATRMVLRSADGAREESVAVALLPGDVTVVRR